MRKRSVTLLVGLLCVLIAAGTSASAAAQETSAQAADAVWRSLDVRETGLYEKKGWVFVVASRPSDMSDTFRHRAWALQTIGRLLYQRAATPVVSEFLGLEGKIAATAAGFLQTGGHLLHSQTSGGRYLYVLAIPAASLDKGALGERARVDIEAHVRSVLANPAAYPEVMRAIGVKELAALIEVARNPETLARIEPARALSGQCVPGERKNTVRPSDIAPLKCSYRSPVLKAVAQNEGLVQFSTAYSAGTPTQKRTIERLFQTASDLPLLIYLLEMAAEEAPRDPWVWEMLEAVYRAGGQTQKAHLAARVWLMVADDKSAAVPYLLAYDPSSAARDLALALKQRATDNKQQSKGK